MRSFNLYLIPYLYMERGSSPMVYPGSSLCKILAATKYLQARVLFKRENPLNI